MQVVELGCGEGGLLADLCQPSPHLDDFPPFLPPPVSVDSGTPSSDGSAGHNASGFTLSSISSVGESSPVIQGRPSPRLTPEAEGPADSVVESRLGILRSVPYPTLAERNHHVQRLYGLDIRPDVLARAAKATAPPEAGDAQTDWYRPRWERWSSLRLELWQGSLDRFNEAFESAECFVASEVIEHLPDDVLKKFAPIVLGKYDARIVVVTTPNYDFNRYFPSADAKNGEEDKHRVPDPTGRTDRFFRDDDHKFEWTQAEFQAWARQAADEHGFDVEFSGCGSYSNYFGGYSMVSSDQPARPKPAPRPDAPADPDSFFATQCAVFRRQFGHDAERSPRSPRPFVLPFLSASGHRLSPQRLYASHDHRAHPRAGKPRSASTIRKTLEGILDEWRQKEAALGTLWNASAGLREHAGGEVVRVVEAVVLAKDADPKTRWSVEVREGRGVDAVWLVWDRDIEPEPTPELDDALARADLSPEEEGQEEGEKVVSAGESPASKATEVSPPTPTMSGWPEATAQSSAPATTQADDAWGGWS